MECYAGNEYDKHGALDNRCNTPCKHDESLSCGGNWSNSVYSTFSADGINTKCKADACNER
jgi:hypothetical protein